MASQNGILGLQGTVGGLVFARNGTVRQKQASNKAAFNSSVSLARTRENASEFGRAGTAGKLIRTALRTLISTASDSLMVSRLTQKTRAIIGLDETNDRGARVMDKDNALELVGFDFNAATSLGQVFFGAYTAAAAGADLTISLASLNGLDGRGRSFGGLPLRTAAGFSGYQLRNRGHCAGRGSRPAGQLAAGEWRPASLGYGIKKLKLRWIVLAKQLVTQAIIFLMAKRMTKSVSFSPLGRK